MIIKVFTGIMVVNILIKGNSRSNLSNAEVAVSLIARVLT
jgi:hypothetical protein